jgi:hypothetical protein
MKPMFLTSKATTDPRSYFEVTAWKHVTILKPRIKLAEALLHEKISPIKFY